VIQGYLDNKNLNNWQVYSYKWVDNSWTFYPSDALNNAKKEGQNLGNSIVAQKWKRVHFIGHSAGAGLIQAATDVIKSSSGSPSIVIQETFLDAYVGKDFSGIVTYGRGANWADSYFTRDKLTQEAPPFPTGPYTESPLLHAYNVDVTFLDPHKTSYVRFTSSPNGDQVAEMCNQTSTVHDWPIYFYANTIVGNVTPEYAGLGFLLSEVGGNWNFASANYKQGNGTDINPAVPTKILGIPDSVCTVIGQISPKSYPNTVLDTTQLPTIQSVSGTVQKFIDHINLLSGSPVWLATVVTSTNPVNTVAFDAKFTSGIGARGVFTILWDTNVIGTLDEQAVSPGIQHYHLSFPNAQANSSHVLGLRLDPFTSIQSAVTLTNIVLNQVGVSQPFSLSVTTNMVNGHRVMRLDGETGFSYNIQASAAVANTNWTDIAILINTNQTGLFYDKDSTNYSHRYYRVVMPQ